MQMTKAFGAYLRDAGADLVHDLEIDAEQVVAAHAGLARHAGGDDADVGALRSPHSEFVPRYARIEAVDRRRLGDVERPCPAAALDDVEQDDVAQFLEPDQMSQRAADLAGADKRDLLTRHGVSKPLCGSPAETPARHGYPLPPAIQAHPLGIPAGCEKTLEPR